MPLKLTSYYHGKDIPELPGRDIFHSKDLFLFYESIPDYTPVLIMATSQGKPIAKLLAVIRKNAHFFPSSFFRRCEVYGTGEYLGDENDISREETFSYMLEHLTNEAFRHAFFIEFRNLNNALDGYKYFRTNNYFAMNWLRVRNSLHRVDEVEEMFSPSRIRQVKKALNNGAEVLESSSIEEIKEFSAMLHKIYSYRIRRFFPGIEFFQQVNTWLIRENLAKIFIIKYKGKIIGGSSVLYSGDNAYLWFSGGMTKRYAHLYPGVLAVWAALTDAKANGYRHMEFMDVGLPFRKHGYRSFVLRFGGKQSSTRRWFRIRWNLLNRFLIFFHS